MEITDIKMKTKKQPTRKIIEKDKVDLRLFPYKVDYWPRSEETSDLIDWLLKNVGTKLIDWASVVSRITIDETKIYFTYEWRFKTKENLILFKLAWLYND